MTNTVSWGGLIGITIFMCLLSVGFAFADGVQPYQFVMPFFFGCVILGRWFIERE
jgi:hypothetical protein